MRFQVLVDRGERVTKCTILPLAGHPALDIVRYHRGRSVGVLAGEVLLHPEGDCLSEVRLEPGAAAIKKMTAIDCTWKRLAAVVRTAEAPLPRRVRIPPGFVTAYPRRNKLDKDPAAGLATIEALFIAAAFLGHWDESLLSRYPFAAVFLAANAATFARYGVPVMARAAPLSAALAAVNAGAFPL